KLNNYTLKLLVALFLCIGIVGAEEVTAQGAVTCVPAITKKGDTQSIKWYRDSAEKKALYNQAYSMGSQYVRLWVKTNHPKPNTWGVILDIDETALDNSWFMYACNGHDVSNEAEFGHYIVNAKKSVALPGVTSFLNLVHELGGYVSFISNRDGTFKDKSGNVLESTLENLKDQNVYFDQVLLANDRDSKDPKNKNTRFTAVISGKYDGAEMVWSNKLPAHKVIAYFGDNIQDFPKLKQATVNSLDGSDEVFKAFGNGYFILPNPIYGSWQKNEYK